MRNILSTLVRCLMVVAFFADAQLLRAQDKTEPFENLSIDRPDISNLPTTINVGHYQFELGTEWSKGSVSGEFNIPNLVFRTGLTDKSELRVGFNQLTIDSIAAGLSDYVTFVSLGGKYRFVEEEGWRPSIAIQPELSFPFGDDAYIHRDIPNYALADLSLIFLFNNTLHEKVFVNYNAGLFWSKNDRVDYLLSTSLSFLHTHRLGYFIEAYSFVNAGDAPFSYDGGLMFLLTPRLQIDAYVGNRTFDNEDSWYWGAGIGFRLDRGDLTSRSFEELGIHH